MGVGFLWNYKVRVQGLGFRALGPGGLGFMFIVEF